MAHGDIIVEQPEFTHVKLIDAAGAVANGVWIDTSKLDSGSLHVIISATATFQLRGSNEATKPADASHGFQIGADITATSGFSVERLPRWLKGRVSAWTSGTVDALGIFRAMRTGR